MVKKNVKEDVVVPVSDESVVAVAVESDVVVSDVVEAASVDVVSVQEPAKEPASVADSKYWIDGHIDTRAAADDELMSNPQEYPGSLRIGESGAGVEKLQYFLHKTGYYSNGDVYGEFGVWTSGALRAFNREVAGKEQSILDQETWILLQS